MTTKKQKPEPQLYAVEFTDTYGGEANYCWTQCFRVWAPNIGRALYHSLVNAKWKLKNRKYLTDAQAARLADITAEIEKREAEAEERKQNARLSAAWDRYLFDV